MSGAAPTREVAYRLFADEFAQSTYSYAESDDDRAPQYLVAPTGARMNRVFVVGVLTEVEEVSDGVLRARIVDPTGAFVCYAGQYQPDALAFFERAEPPTFVALTAKTRTFEPEGADRIFTSLRPEQVNEVTPGTRDSWVVETAEQTLERAALTAQALDLPERGDRLRDRLADAGLEPGLAAGIPEAIAEYDVTTDYLAAVQEMALEAVEVVAGDREAVETVAGAPSEAAPGEVRTGFASLTLSAPGAETGTAEVEAEDEEPDPDSVAEPDIDEPGPSVDEEPTATVDQEPASEPAAETEPVDAETSNADQTASLADETTDASVTTAEPATDEPPVSDGATATGETEPEADAVEPEADEEAVETGAEAESVESTDETAEEGEEELYELSAEERAEVEENFDVGFESGSEIGSPEETPDIEPEAGSPAATADEPDDAVPAATGSETTDEEPAETDSGTEAESSEEPEAEAETVDPENQGSDDGATDQSPEPEPESEESTAPEETPDEEPEPSKGATDEEPATEEEEPLDPDADPEDLVVETLRELGDGDSVPRSELVATVEERSDLSAEEIEDGIQSALLGGRCFESGADALKPI
jgi:RPA family protein